MYRKRYVNNDPRIITAKFSSKCSCGEEIKKGEKIIYWPLTKTAQHYKCGISDYNHCITIAFEEDHGYCHA